MLSLRLRCCILLLAYCYSSGAQITLQPATIEPKVSESPDGEVCTSETNALQRAQIDNEVKQILNSSINEQFIGVYRRFPASSCADIYLGHPSGYYWLNVTNEPQLVYCSLNENRCCGESDGKWMRIAFLNMSDPSEECPDGWREVPSPIRSCRKQFNTGQCFIQRVGCPGISHPLTWISPLKLTDSTAYFVLISHPNGIRSSIYLS